MTKVKISVNWEEFNRGSKPDAITIINTDHEFFSEDKDRKMVQMKAFLTHKLSGDGARADKYQAKKNIPDFEIVE